MLALLLLRLVATFTLLLSCSGLIAASMAVHVRLRFVVSLLSHALRARFPGCFPHLLSWCPMLSCDHSPPTPAPCCFVPLCSLYLVGTRLLRPSLRFRDWGVSVLRALLFDMCYQPLYFVSDCLFRVSGLSALCRPTLGSLCSCVVVLFRASVALLLPVPRGFLHLVSLVQSVSDPGED
jgi:hypothetical protein